MAFMWDNLSFWIWLVIVVVSFLAQRRKKLTQNEAPEVPNGTPEAKPISFEDLLREIQTNKIPQAPKTQDTPTPQSMATYTDYEEKLSDEQQDLEQVDYKKQGEDATFDVYEKAKLAAFNRSSLEETLKLEDTDVRFGQFKGYQFEQPLAPAQAFIDDLRDPAGFRKVFIMSEILNRKY
ncbi:MAG: hypothetical protein ACKO96_18125 [Flammeovirgaceae bacterium]